MDNVSYLAQSAFPLVWIAVPAIGAHLRARRATSPGNGWRSGSAGGPSARSASAACG
ncbi:hypothetical protein ACFQHO_46730 [Actinomadura yumaensis]|uniref:hypothetical protein n=1 Tax=Actinomadura yumaensis TaxID=111807 RepID=UPI00361D291A